MRRRLSLKIREGLEALLYRQKTSLVTLAESGEVRLRKLSENRFESFCFWM